MRRSEADRVARDCAVAVYETYIRQGYEFALYDPSVAVVLIRDKQIDCALRHAIDAFGATWIAERIGTEWARLTGLPDIYVYTDL